MKIRNVLSFFIYLLIFVLVVMNKHHKTEFSPERKYMAFNFHYLECVSLLVIIHDFYLFTINYAFLIRHMLEF